MVVRSNVLKNSRLNLFKLLRELFPHLFLHSSSLFARDKGRNPKFAILLILLMSFRYCKDDTDFATRESSIYCPCDSSQASAAAIRVRAPTSVLRATSFLLHLKMKSLRPVHSRITSVTTQPGFKQLMMTRPSLDEAVESSASSRVTRMSSILDTLYLVRISSPSSCHMKGLDQSYLSCILAFFSSPSKSKIFSAFLSSKVVR